MFLFHSLLRCRYIRLISNPSLHYWLIYCTIILKLSYTRAVKRCNSKLLACIKMLDCFVCLSSFSFYASLLLLLIEHLENGPQRFCIFRGKHNIHKHVHNTQWLQCLLRSTLSRIVWPNLASICHIATSMIPACGKDLETVILHQLVLGFFFLPPKLVLGYQVTTPATSRSTKFNILVWSNLIGTIF